MPIAAYTMPVNAPVSIAWQTLRDAIEFPQRFTDSVEAVRIIDRDGGSWVREMRLVGLPQREQVSVDDKTLTITAVLIEHPLYTGRIVTRVEVPSASATQREPRLSFRMDWTARSGSDDPGQSSALSSALERELLAVKRAAEAQAVLSAA